MFMYNRNENTAQQEVKNAGLAAEIFDTTFKPSQTLSYLGGPSHVERLFHVPYTQCLLLVSLLSQMRHAENANTTGISSGFLPKFPTPEDAI
jgi:hypothetical protein